MTFSMRLVTSQLVSMISKTLLVALVKGMYVEATGMAQVTPSLASGLLN
jgi:hypothetical protein